MGEKDATKQYIEAERVFRLSNPTGTVVPVCVVFSIDSLRVDGYAHEQIVYNRCVLERGGYLKTFLKPLEDRFPNAIVLTKGPNWPG